MGLFECRYSESPQTGNNLNPYNDIPLNHKKERATDTYKTQMNSNVLYSVKPDLKSYILYDSIYMTSWKRQNYKDRN